MPTEHDDLIAAREACAVNSKLRHSLASAGNYIVGNRDDSSEISACLIAIRNERRRIAKVLDVTPDEIRLAAGDVSAERMLDIKAVIWWLKARAGL